MRFVHIFRCHAGLFFCWSSCFEQCINLSTLSYIYNKIQGALLRYVCEDQLSSMAHVSTLACCSCCVASSFHFCIVLSQFIPLTLRIYAITHFQSMYISFVNVFVNNTDVAKLHCFINTMQMWKNVFFLRAVISFYFHESNEEVLYENASDKTIGLAPGSVGTTKIMFSWIWFFFFL